MINIGVGGAWKTGTFSVGVGGVWKTVTGSWVGVGGAWKTLLASPLSLATSPTFLNASIRSAGPVNRPILTTSTVTVTPSGGSGTYTHSWTIAFAYGIDADGSCGVTSPTSATTSFSVQTCDGQDSPGIDTYIATDTVTDTVSGAVSSVSLNVLARNTYVSNL